jgi:hypothetical protein
MSGIRRDSRWLSNGGILVKHTRAFSTIVAVSILCLAALTLTACTGGVPKGPVSPGLKAGKLSGMEVVGYLARPDTQDGAWTVYDIKPGPSSAIQPKALATLRAGSVDKAGIEALDGRYIWAAGRASGDAEVPEIRVDGIEVVQEP